MYNSIYFLKTTDLSINIDFNKPYFPLLDATCEDFADHFRNKISAIGCNLLFQQNVINMIEEQFSHRETLSSLWVELVEFSLKLTKLPAF